MTIGTFIVKNALRNKRRATLSILSVAVSLFLLTTLLVALRELTVPPEGEGAALRVIVRCLPASAPSLSTSPGSRRSRRSRGLAANSKTRKTQPSASSPLIPKRSRRSSSKEKFRPKPTNSSRPTARPVSSGRSRRTNINSSPATASRSPAQFIR
jgi:hypothetical protein